MDARAHARVIVSACIYFKLILPAHTVCIVLQGFILTTARARLNFNRTLSAITAVVQWCYTRPHTWCKRATAGPSSVLALTQGQVTCGCSGEERHSWQTEMTAVLFPQHSVCCMRGNEARWKMRTPEDEEEAALRAWFTLFSLLNCLKCRFVIRLWQRGSQSQHPIAH